MNIKKQQIRKDHLKDDLDLFFQAAMSALCHCYDHTEGFYPESCGCDSTAKVEEAVRMLVREHKNLIRKYGL